MTGPSERLTRALRERYRIERTLGAGGMATVYLAEDLRHDRKVALKVLRPELVSLLGPGRFLREIGISGKLSHPHILPLFDSGEAGGVPWYTMPFVEGESLRDRLAREGQLSIADALRITFEVAGALSHAHAQGIIHRDIKPENIMLANGHALVADFGIARAVTASGADRLTGTGMAIGTVEYMSPEQATGTAELDARSDLYSLACVLYEMLAGGPPFPAASVQGVLARHLVDPVPPIRTVRASVPAHVEAAILVALAKSRADRFPNVAAFVEVLDGKQSPPAQTVPEGPAVHAGARRRWLVAGVALTGLLAVAAWIAVNAPSPDPGRVLVGLFEDRTGDQALDGLAGATAAALVSGLASTGLVQPTDAPGVRSEGSRARDYPSLRPLARRVGAGSVVSGSISRRADSLEFQIRLTDVATGELLRPVRPVVWPARDPAGAAGLVAQRVMAAYGAHFDPRFRNYTTVSQPSRYDALREFQVGVKVYWDAGGLLDSTQVAAMLAHFRRAIALDSTFMAPRIGVAKVQAEFADCRGTDSVVAALPGAGTALLSSDRARVVHVVAECAGDPRARYAAAQQLFRDAPDLAENVFLVSQAALLYHRPREALSCLDRLERTPDHLRVRDWCWNITMHAHHRLGQYREALQLIERIRADLPETPFLERYQMRQWAALGLVDTVEALIEQRLVKSSQTVRAGDDMLWVGEELRGHGHVAAGRALCERGAVWYDSRPSAELRILEARVSLAQLAYCAERWDEARAAYERLAADDSSETGIAYRTRLGALAARRGDSAEVARLDRWLAARDHRPRASYGRAVIAAFLGDRARALALFQVAWERGQPNFIEVHTDSALEPLRDYPPFVALLNSQ